MKATEVTLAQDEPAAVLWNRRSLRVLEISDHWSELGRWWEHESQCEFYLVETTLGLMLLAFDLSMKQWYAKRVQ
jgi:hypothetical protein